MTGLLRTRRWIGFTALVLVAIIAFGLLSAWQWSRAEERRAERQALQAASSAEPVPLTDLSTSDTTAEWTPIVVRGTYGDDQVVVRKRPYQARNGFWVMAPLAHDGGIIWVNRGWIPTSGDALATPDIPPPPAGDVQVTGFLRTFEDAAADANEGLPDRQVAAPTLDLLPEVGADGIGYLQMQASSPADDAVTLLPPPEVDEGRNISYAVQWALFALVAIGGWFFFLRREARDDERPDEAAAPTPAPATRS